jgi:hypothetical protein
VSVHVCAVLCVCGYITSPRVSFWGWAPAIKRRQAKKKRNNYKKERERDNVKSRSFRIFTSTVFLI